MLSFAVPPYFKKCSGRLAGAHNFEKLRCGAIN